MEDKLLKTLKIKIDAINRNIDNLNYLNGELEKNNDDLDYIESKIALFKDNDMLNFDNISKEDFDKVLSMINPSVSEIFQDKTCNYDGIIYIIEGIRKSISLELTIEQKNAIISFVSGMKEKREFILDTISNLSESKKRLPETDLTVLTTTLENYNNIVSKFENDLYLTEIDEICDALDFADTSIEDKANVFEFILKYNAQIYSLKEQDVFSGVSYNENQDNEEKNNQFEPLNEFTFEPQEDILNNEIKFNQDLNNEENIDNKQFDEQSLENIKLKLDDFNFENEFTNKDINNNIDLNQDIFDKTIDVSQEVDTKEEAKEKNDEIGLSEEDNHELNTIELEDIINKIDAKLKEMDENDINKVQDEYQEINPDSEAIFNENNVSSEESESNLSELNFKPLDDTENNFAVETPEVPKENINNNIGVEIPEVSSQVSSSGDLNNINTTNSVNLELKNQVKTLLTKYNIDFEIETSNVTDLELMLKTMDENVLIDIFNSKKEIFSKLLVNYSSTTLNELFMLIKENLMSKKDKFNYVIQLLLDTVPLLFTNTNVFETFRKNIDFYKEKNINIINIFDNYRELLIINNNDLVINYNKVNSYGLAITNDNVKYFLYNKDILNDLDYYIEAIGYEKGFLGHDDMFDGVNYITKNPYKLSNASKDMLLKLRYVSENNGKIYGNKPGILSGEITNPKVNAINLTSEYLNSFFNGEYDAISKNELKNELINLDSYDMSIDNVIMTLDEKYKVDDLRYKFNNTVVSRIKTIRIYNYLKNKLDRTNALVIGLTYNSVIENSEYQKIVETIKELLGGM